ncbi:MAG: YggS family pyridoxal phosphate-dependent enzyme [Enterovibrio sp.]
MPTPNAIEQNITLIFEQISQIAKQSQRNSQEIQLLAVTKTKPVTDIAQAIEAGITQFGENYVQEAVEKINYFSTQHTALTWHLIGPLQSNKTAVVAENFAWVHTVSRSKIAQRLSQQRPAQLAPLQLLIQINMDNETTKSGIPAEKIDEIIALADEITNLPHLTLRGLMSIPKATLDKKEQLATFEKIAKLFAQLKPRYANFDTLSIGMSNDMDMAIKAGSTMVRIGSAIFGARNSAGQNNV